MINKHILSTIVAILFVNIAMYAVPADKRPKPYVQPDGKTLIVTKYGDEHGHYYLTEDGYLLILTDGYMRYAGVDDNGNIIDSGINASSLSSRDAAESDYLKELDMDMVHAALADRRVSSYTSARRSSARSLSESQGPGLFPGTHFPLKGSPKGIAILVEFQDVHFSVDNPGDFYYRMLNEPGFSDYGATGSASDYFVDNSMGVFTPTFDVYGPVTLPQSYKYYGENDRFGTDKRAEEMVIDGCRLLDDVVDFSEYDFDNDGYVDNVYVIYAGEGEATSFDDNTVWPHSYELWVNYSPLWIDGVMVDSYACSNEEAGGIPEGIGNFVHEFSHVMGLPDLYTTDNSNAFTPGEWSVMDYGSYCNEGRTPPYYTAFERYALGWITPKVLGEEEETIALDPISANQCCLIPTNDDNEFFLLENRQQEGWDAYIPGHGMLVWHIHYNEYMWESNTVNNNSNHQYVDIVEADNRRSEMNRNADSFPGTKNVTSFTSATTPALKTWSNEPIDCPITEIAENDGIISFVACKGKSGIADIATDAYTVSAGDGAIYVSGVQASVDVYSASGAMIMSAAAPCVIPVPAGLYIVKCGSSVHKLVVR